jgi:hypothetical protein
MFTGERPDAGAFVLSPWVEATARSRTYRETALRHQPAAGLGHLLRLVLGRWR